MRTLNKDEMSRKMQEFLTTPNCRRRLLLDYFTNGKEKNSSTELFAEKCCDNCTAHLTTNENTDDMIDVTAEQTH